MGQELSPVFHFTAFHSFSPFLTPIYHTIITEKYGRDSEPIRVRSEDHTDSAMFFPSPDSDELDRVMAEAISYPDEIHSTGDITNPEYWGVLSCGQKSK